MVMQKYLGLKFEGKEESDFKDFYLSYDNMCNVCSLKLLQKPLPLPPPQDKLFSSINKIIDPLHIANHKRESCRVLYNPDIVKQAFPEGNLMTRGQRCIGKND